MGIYSTLFKVAETLVKHCVLYNFVFAYKILDAYVLLFYPFFMILSSPPFSPLFTLV